MDYNTSVIQFYILENKNPIKILRQLQLRINIHRNDHSPHRCQAQYQATNQESITNTLDLMTDAYTSAAIIVATHKDFTPNILPPLLVFYLTLKSCTHLFSLE